MTGVAWSLGDLRQSLRRCAGCHDQCLAVTSEVVASGDQSLALSRLAAMVLRLADGNSTWSTGAAARLFVSAADDLADEVCIHRESGHRVAPWLREARARSIRLDLMPEMVRAAREAVAAHQNIWGLQESLPPVPAGDPGAVVLVHEATGRLAEQASIAAQLRLLARSGQPASDLAVASSGALELESGLLDEARTAARAALDRIAGLDVREQGITFTSADPHLVWMLAEGIGLLGLPRMSGVEHLSVTLARGMPSRSRSTSEPGDGKPRSVVYHDPGILARRLGVTQQPRSLLDAAGLERREARTRARLARTDGGLPAALGDPVAMEVARMRLAELRAAGADLIVTAAPLSQMALRAGDANAATADLFLLLDRMIEGDALA